MSPELHQAAPVELDAGTLYRILQLRVDVFVVEQRCPYRELDGRDLEPGTRWLWATDGDTVLGTLRILREDRHTARIGRVATAARARTGGIATLLMRHALDLLDAAAPEDTASIETAATAGNTATAANTATAGNTAESTSSIEVVLDAQTPLAGWYQRFGFQAAGPEFVEDGISHLPMRRSPACSGRRPGRSGT